MRPAAQRRPLPRSASSCRRCAAWGSALRNASSGTCSCSTRSMRRCCADVHAMDGTAARPQRPTAGILLTVMDDLDALLDTRRATSSLSPGCTELCDSPSTLPPPTRPPRAPRPPPRRSAHAAPTGRRPRALGRRCPARATGRRQRPPELDLHRAHQVDAGIPWSARYELAPPSGTSSEVSGSPSSMPGLQCIRR